MGCKRKNLIETVVKRAMFMAVCGLLFSPAAIYAESLKLYYAAKIESLRSEPAVKTPKKPAELLPFLGVEKGGDVVIRTGNVSLVMAYNSADDVHRFMDRARDIQPLERPLLNGVSITICCLF